MALKPTLKPIGCFMTIAVLVLAAGSAPAVAVEGEAEDEPLRVLWLGTGFSFYNQFDEQVGEWMAAAGRPWAIDDTYLWPISSLLDDEPERWSPKNVTPADIRERVEGGAYDLLLIQCKVEYFSEDDGERERMDAVFDYLVTTARQAGALPVLYSTERPRIRDGAVRGSGDEEHERLLAAARSHDVLVIDSYRATRELLLRHPEIDLLPELSDSHPMGLETYLNLCLMDAAVLGRDPAAQDLPLRCRYAPVVEDEDGKRRRDYRDDEGNPYHFTVAAEHAAIIWDLTHEIATAERALVGLEPGQVAWEVLD